MKGQVISTGSPLLRIGDEKLSLDLDRLRAELQVAEAQLEQSRRLATIEEPVEEPVEEVVLEAEAEAPAYEFYPDQEPTFSQLASEIQFTSVDAGGIWPGIDPRIIETSENPQDAGGIWPSYGDREMVNGEGSFSAMEPATLAAFLPSPSSTESTFVPGGSLNQPPLLVATAQMITPPVTQPVTETQAVSEFSEAESRLSLDQARVEVIRAEIAMVENELASRTLSSPFDGRIREVATSEGAQVKPGDLLVEIIQVDPIEFSFPIPKEQVDLLELGMEIKGRLSNLSGLPFEGEISFIGAELNADKTSVEIRAQVDNPDDVFKVGVEGSAEIATVQVGSQSTSD